MENTDCVQMAEPSNRTLLIERAVSAIMELTEDERLRVLSKYAERYGVKL